MPMCPTHGRVIVRMCLSRVCPNRCLPIYVWTASIGYMSMANKWSLREASSVDLILQIPTMTWSTFVLICARVSIASRCWCGISERQDSAISTADGWACSFLLPPSGWCPIANGKAVCWPNIRNAESLNPTIV